MKRRVDFSRLGVCVFATTPSVVSTPPSTAVSQEELQALVLQMHSELAAKSAELTAATTELAQVTSERDKLRRAYDQLLEQMALLQRRIFVAKAERIDPRQLELALEETKKQLDTLAVVLGEATSDETVSTPSDAENRDASDSVGNRPAGKPSGARQAKPKGRRNLADAEMNERRIEILDPELEGQVERIGWEYSYKLGYQRPGPVRLVIARAKYKANTESGEATIATAARPRSLLSRSLLAPSMLARIIVAKFRFGMPYFRQEQALTADGIELDRGTMARSVEDTGASLGAIVLACADDARKNAFCLSTDATGISIRPEPLADGSRQSCRKGHFFVVIADKRHVFFEYQPKHTSAAVCEMFRGFSGYVQADAHTVYDALFRGDAVDGAADAPLEVACWAHTRRRYWEAAVSGYSVGRAGLLRIRKLYELDQSWSQQPPSARAMKRQTILKPLIDEFFAWAHAEYAAICDERGLVTKALGYAIRQETALRRFLEDGRLRMDNNPSEGALRPIATGRKSWLFFGSDDHASAAANLFSLIASCKLHGLDPERYLAEVIHVMPYWPRERYLDLAPAFWAQTRARIHPTELASELGNITVPPPINATEQPPSD